MSGPDVTFALLWSGGGLVLGLLLGYFGRKALEATVNTTPQGPTKTRSTFAIGARRIEIKRALSVMGGIIVLLLAVVSSVRYYQVTACQADYNRGVQRALFERSDASRQETEAQIKLLTSQSSGDPAAGRAAILEYITALQELERARAVNPLPNPDQCGDNEQT